jgi:site-specific DNA-methyltransferase (adenine-specific)
MPEDNGHPCPKPLRVMSWIVERTTRPSDVILDPFMGSGTTLRAAKDSGRSAIGIEIEERYCEMAVERLGQGVLNFA